MAKGQTEKERCKQDQGRCQPMSLQKSPTFRVWNDLNMKHSQIYNKKRVTKGRRSFLRLSFARIALEQFSLSTSLLNKGYLPDHILGLCNGSYSLFPTCQQSLKPCFTGQVLFWSIARVARTGEQCLFVRFRSKREVLSTIDIVRADLRK